MAGIMDFLQAASNEAAGTVSAPADAIAWLLRKAGIPVHQPIGGSDWMQQRGLTRPVKQSAASLAGFTAGLLSPVAAAAKAPQIAKGLLQAGDNLAAPRTLNPQTGAIVWHGSPHKFDAFDSSKIGTGEGAQAYGHGLYLAEAPDVAKSYQALDPVALASPVRAFKGMELNAGTPEYHAATLLDNMGLQQARKQVSGWIANADPRMAREVEGWKKTLETLNAATSKADFKRLKNTGSLYKVDLPDEQIAKMLDWDKPLSQQAPEIQRAVNAVMEKRAAAAEAERLALNASSPGRLTHPVLGKIASKPRTALDYKGEAAVSQLVQELGGPDKAATFLRAQGIPGIRYLDGGSRGAGTGTSNYVVFPGNEGLLKILERNGQALP